MKHELKTWPEFFQSVWDGNKTFEVRKNDRDYKVGDSLILREWEPSRESYTGRTVGVKVKYILLDSKFVKEGLVIMGIEVPR